MITGSKPESFESIARRYVSNPSLIHPRLSRGGRLKAIAFMLRMILSRVPDFDQWESDMGHPILNNPVLAHDSQAWRATAERRQLNLLSAAVESQDLTIAPSRAG